MDFVVSESPEKIHFCQQIEFNLLGTEDKHNFTISALFCVTYLDNLTIVFLLVHHWIVFLIREDIQHCAPACILDPDRYQQQFHHDWPTHDFFRDRHRSADLSSPRSTVATRKNERRKPDGMDGARARRSIGVMTAVHMYLEQQPPCLQGNQFDCLNVWTWLVNASFFSFVSSWYFCPSIIHEDQANKTKKCQQNQPHPPRPRRHSLSTNVLTKDHWTWSVGPTKTFLFYI